MTAPCLQPYRQNQASPNPGAMKTPAQSRQERALETRNAGQGICSTPQAVGAIARIMGFLMICIGVQFVINGVRELVGS